MQLWKSSGNRRLPREPVRASICRNQRGKNVRASVWSAATGHEPLARSDACLQGIPAAVEHPHGLLSRLAELTACRRQRGRVGAAVDERDAEPPLKGLDAATEGGLRDVTLLSGARKTARPCEAHEVLKPL